jgi:hypothetical protein
MRGHSASVLRLSYGSRDVRDDLVAMSTKSSIVDRRAQRRGYGTSAANQLLIEDFPNPWHPV